MNARWRERKRPNRLEGRFEFADYTSLSDFLEQAADLSEGMSLFPDIGFGRDYANFMIAAEEGADALGDTQRALATQLDALFDAQEDR
jgi:pterin-4a-carbinolamine dehydratase